MFGYEKEREEKNGLTLHSPPHFFFNRRRGKRKITKENEMHGR